MNAIIKEALEDLKHEVRDKAKSRIHRIHRRERAQ